jgi:hypothetical protein
MIEPGTYTLLLDTDLNINGSSTLALNTNDSKLTIIGLGEERKITLLTPGRLLTVGANWRTGIELTLGNNITIAGHAANTNAVISVRSDAALIMLPGSRITGNINSSTDSDGDWGTPAIINRGNFTMRGGVITNNQISPAGSTRAGAVYVRDYGTVNLQGGVINGNVSGAGDVYVMHTASVPISGNAQVGKLTISTAGDIITRLTIAAGWTGNIGALNLASGFSVEAPVITSWLGEQVIEGPGFNPSLLVERILLGNFISNSVGSLISANHLIDASGVLVEK